MARNYKPETRSLLRSLKTAGFCIGSVYDGGENITIDSETTAVEAICSVDESTLTVRINGRSLRLFLVLGNEPGELVCDHTDCDLLENVVSAHYDKWENRKQPTRSD